jgi:UDP-2-acetamido-3-amino-2,3-dideoxy-glucuronate N-acetyltransferase
MIHETAEVAPGAKVGEGTRLWQYVQVREGASIGSDCVLGKAVYVDKDVTIGDRCKLQNGSSVFSPAVLEDGVFLGPGVLVTNDRVPRAVNPDGALKAAADWDAVPVTIRTGAAIGAGSVVLAGVTVGRWALVGAGSVVRQDVPPHGLVVGTPARLIGYVCACGARLADEAGSRVCPECAEEYGAEIEE